MSEIKLPPQSSDVERAILGAILYEPECIDIAIERLSPEMFYMPDHAIIFSEMIACWEAGVPIDQFILAERLKDKGNIDKIGGEIVLATMLAECASAAHIKIHCDIIGEKYKARQIIAQGNLLITRCHNGDESCGVVNHFNAELDKISDTSKASEFTLPADYVPRTHEALAERAENQTGIIGISTGIPKLNRIIGGLQDGDLIYIAGYSSQGKTTLALNFALSALKHDKKVGFFSLEMNEVKLCERLIADIASFDVSKIHYIKPDSAQWAKIAQAAEWLSSAPLIIDPSAGMTINEITAKAKRMQNKHGIDVLFIDYLQLIMGDKGVDSRQQQLEDISRGLTRLKKILKIPIVVLSQFHNPKDGNIKRLPGMTALRGSGAIPQDADIIIFIHTPGKDEFNLIVEKNRAGGIGAFKVLFQKEYCRILELDDTY